MNVEKLEACRYRGDLDHYNSLKNHPRLGKRIEDAKSAIVRRTIRSHLLHSMVRVDARLLPQIAGSMARLQPAAGLADAIEMYVFESSAVNAFITRGRSHLFVALSSGAINILTERELEFVIGHELGHAMFDHVDFTVGHLLEDSSIEPRDRMQMFAWKRAAEISADRMGLIFCGSLDIAATAMFKTLSGLRLDGVTIDVAAFAEQWDHLMAEVVQSGDADGHWQVTHPFPPLRIKAMQLFWRSDYFEDAEGMRLEGSRPSLASIDQETAKLLAMMDPLARDDRNTGNPLLVDFFQWGGLHIALSNGELTSREKDRLASIVSADRMNAAINGRPTVDSTLKQFVDCLERRDQRLKTLEIHKIMEGLMHIANADGQMDANERQALLNVAGKLGVSPLAVEMMITKFPTQG